MPGIIDADTHISESEAMWSMIDKGHASSAAGDDERVQKIRSMVRAMPSG